MSLVSLPEGCFQMHQPVMNLPTIGRLSGSRPQHCTHIGYQPERSPQEKRKTVAKHTHALMQDSRVGIRLTQQQKKPPPPGSEPSSIHFSTSEYALGPQHEACSLVLSSEFIFSRGA